MRWVDVNEQLPLPSRRVLVAMHAGTEWQFVSMGRYCVNHWLVDGYTRNVGLSEIKYWAPIAQLPKEWRENDAH